jgi:hypothetical protein
MCRSTRIPVGSLSPARDPEDDPDAGENDYGGDLPWPDSKEQEQQQC